MTQDERVDNTLNLLNRLDGWLHANRPDYYAKLLPGLSAAEVDEFEQKLGVQLPVEFKLFYQWKNGCKKREWGDEFVAGFYFPSSSAIYEIAEMLNELVKSGDFDRANWWNYSWIPFLENITGDCICLDLEGSFTGTSGQILIFWHDWKVREIICYSFFNWLETIVFILEDGRYWQAEEDEQNELFWELWKEKNPGYPIEHEAG